MSMIKEAIRETSLSLRHRPGSRLVTLLMVSLAFVVFDTFLIISFNLQNLMDRERGAIGMEVFLEVGVSEAEARTIGDLIAGIQGVESVYYVSPAEAEALFRSELPEHSDLLEVMGNEFSLPASLQVTFVDQAGREDVMESVSRAVSAMEGVRETVYGEDFLPGLIRTVSTIRRLVLLLGIVLVFSISMVVFYTVRLSVVRRALTVDIMRTVGAPWWFIRIPFVVEGVIMGTAGSAGGLILAASLSSILASAVSHRFIPPGWITVVILLGAFTGTIGALAGSYEKERRK
ncbi:MAG TPA: permease-like cell division protein FtsX [Candidatus Sabulitectum sp.]|nr:permease-like cell division protein FtsX [Candidatus Sabulitectum sp.]HPF32715.1 permease-like cell division protein FtsX [Candidatus Sabulitectum sp.]HPJ28414.1 permease-like cell division protein FtsX [Candidatus Sabulitectum sp.]HPR22048.1 permease-like cell division protein FtsX [Candidatus Sabulitectum sp.]